MLISYMSLRSLLIQGYSAQVGLATIRPALKPDHATFVVNILAYAQPMSELLPIHWTDIGVV